MPARASGSIAVRNSSTSPCVEVERIRPRGFLEHLRVGELLEELERELEVLRASAAPSSSWWRLTGSGRTTNSLRRCRSARHRTSARRTCPSRAAAGLSADRRCRSTCLRRSGNSSPRSRCERYGVFRFVEAKDDLRASDEDGPLDQVGLLHHQVDCFLLRFRQRPRLEHRAARAHEIQEAVGLDVLLEKRAVRRVLVDVALLDLDALLIQKTSGVTAGRSGGFPEEGRPWAYPAILASTIE